VGGKIPLVVVAAAAAEIFPEIKNARGGLQPFVLYSRTGKLQLP